MLREYFELDMTAETPDYDPLERFYLQKLFYGLSIGHFMESSYGLSEKLLTVICDESGLSHGIVWSILRNIRNPKYAEALSEITRMVIERTEISDRAEILEESFFEKLDRLVLRSKHNRAVSDINDACYNLVSRIFSDHGKDLKKYRSVRSCQLKKAIVFVIYVSMVVYLRHYQEQQFVA